MQEAPFSRAETILATLRQSGSEANRAGMARFGINVARAWGVPVAVLRRMAKDIGRDPALARALWQSGVHEARILACRIHDPQAVDHAALDAMAREIDSWDLCDQFTNNLARRVPGARGLARDWLAGPAPFVKRAGLSLLASLAVHDKESSDAVFKADLAAVADVAADGRQPVKKAVSWALRQIGKRNPRLRRAARETAQALLAKGRAEARFAARETLRELAEPVAS